MPETPFAALRDYAETVVRQPDFSAVRRRAARVRRRRTVAASAAALTLTLVVVGLGYAMGAGGDGSPAPSTGAGPDAGWPRLTNVVATGPADIYAVYEQCRDCTLDLYASADAGATWQRRTLPPAPDGAAAAAGRLGDLVPLGPAMLAWQDAVMGTYVPGTGFVPLTSSPTELFWTTVDGGRTWRHAEVGRDPVAAVPPGTRPVDCALVGRPSPCQIYAVDPTTGRFAPLAHQPARITFEANWMAQIDAPIGADLWVPGLDPATGKPAVASSSDGGRTWHTHVFTDGVRAVPVNGLTPTMYVPTVAAGADGLAYALTYRDDRTQVAYRTTDGGVTWRPVSGGPVPQVPGAGYVTADGAHVVPAGDELAASRDGGAYQRVTLPGFPLDLLPVMLPASQPAPGCYLLFSDSRLYLSGDGRTWRRVDVP